jgi:4'-phosphopantetheinyl transferase
MNLGDRTVHIWPIRLCGTDSDLAAFDATLTADERARANRFLFPHLRRTYTFGRGILRRLLADYTGLPPGAVTVVYGPQGKPALAASTRVRFNVSHSGDHALYAFTLDCDIGVDIEAVRPIPDLQQIARQFFCRAEESDLLALPPDQQQLAFSRCWTRKEAYVKAKGGGLSIPLDSFRVSLRPGEETRFLGLPPTESGVLWTLQNLQVFDGFAAAVAYPDTRRLLEIFPAKDAAELAVA